MPGFQLSLYTRERLRALMSENSTVKHAMTELGKEGIRPCRQTVWRFWVHYRRNKTIKPLPRNGRPTKLTERVLELIEQKMQSDDETTVKELALLIRSEFGYWISLRTVLKGRKLLGWTSRGAAYCQLIRQQNKRSASGGLEKISLTILLTLCGRTKLQCNSKHTGGSAAGKRAEIRSPTINHAQNTPSNSMFGLASATAVRQSSAYSTVS